MTQELSSKQKSLLKGMLAGMLGGLVATAARTYAERLYPPHPHEEPKLLTETTVFLVEPRRPTAPIRWSFGALTGAAYGGLVEFYPAATEQSGASFGLVLASLTQNSLPELATPTEDKAGQEQASAMTANMVYGVVTETVRSAVRRFL